MSYGILITKLGDALLASAEASGKPLVLSSLAIGDGNGSEVTPTGLETELVHRVFHTAFSTKNVNESDTSVVDLVASIPPTEGGWMMREVGVFTSDGQLFAYGNSAVRYQPTATEGATSDSTVTVRLKVGSAALVTIIVDYSSATASQQYVQNYTDQLVTSRLDAAMRLGRLMTYFIGQGC